MNTFRLLRLPLAAVAIVAMLTGCGEATRITEPDNNTSELDTTPPPAPAGMTVQHDEFGHSFLTWDASAASDVVGYLVYVYSPSPERDNAYVLADDPNTTDSHFQLPGADQVTTAFFRIRAVDAAGNRSAMSTEVTTILGPGGGSPSSPFEIQ